MPGYSVPIGFSNRVNSDGNVSLPVGIHLLADHWQDHKLLRLAHYIEKESGWATTERMPNFHFDPFL
jgi:Asp-tRNA(Asn)/Glu-tRNA(Gln) amidotransferase A subunit family amidase